MPIFLENQQIFLLKPHGLKRPLPTSSYTPTGKVLQWNMHIFCGTAIQYPAMNVCLDEAVTIAETTYKMLVETYNEILEIAEEFEDSFKQSLYNRMQSILEQRR